MARDSLKAEDLSGQGLAEPSLRALRVFVAVEEAGSMALAAERLGASPSAVSQQITNLEKAVGARILDRAARPIALTPAGSVLRRHAQLILEAVGAARAELMELNLSSLPELRLGIIDDLDASVTPVLIGQLQRRYPRSRFSARSGRSDLLTDALVRREIDVAITAETPGDLAAFDLFPLLKEPFVLATAPGLVDPARPALPQLEAAPFVGYDPAMPLGRAITRQLRRLRLAFPERFVFDASRPIFAMVQECGGWAITTPLSLLDSERIWDGLEILPLPFTGFSRTIHLVARRAELGHLPDQLATASRDLIETRLLPRFFAKAPWTRPHLSVLRPDEAESRTGTAAFPAVQ